MSELERNIPDDFWRKAFEEAAEPPPPRVWDAVEHRLDEATSRGPRLLPLWAAGLASSRPFVWGMGLAAAVSLVMVGWWATQTRFPHNPVAQAPITNQAERVATVPKAPSPSGAPAKTARPSISDQVLRRSPETIVLADKPATRSRATGASAVTLPARLAKQPDNGLLAQTIQERPLVRSVRGVPAAGSMNTQSARSFINTGQQRSYDQTQASAKALRSLEPATLAGIDQAQQTLAFNQLRGRPMHLHEMGPIQRIVWMRPADAVAETDPESAVKPKHESREFWASVALMPGAFDPSVSVRSAQPLQGPSLAATVLNTATTSTQSVYSRASFSVAYQAGAGLQLNEHWSVESGVGYLVGRSTVESPARTIGNSLIGTNNPTVALSNLYADALQNSLYSTATANGQKASSDYLNYTNSSQYLARSNYNDQTRQTLANNYRYVQMPVQVGYQLRPRKRLSLALLGGLLTNVFVRNTVDDDLVVTTKDGVYRPVSWAAIMGARFRYRPSRQWSASLAGTYQPSLGLGTRPGSEVLSRPTSTGVSFGVDYHF